MKKRIISMMLVLALLMTSVWLLVGCAGGGNQDAAVKELSDYLANLKATYDYAEEDMTALTNAYNAGVEAVKAASGDADVKKATADAKTAMDGVKTAGAKAYTLNDYTQASPSVWNSHNWVTNGDDVIMSYAEMGLVEPAMKTEGEYEWVFEMATAIEDITANATAAEKEKWEITEGQTAGRMWKISLNPDAKWENGTVINADTYIYSMQQLISSEMKNSRADLYWSGENAVFNGEQYFKQDKIGEKTFASLSALGMSADEALTAGYELYVDMAGLWGVNTADGTGKAAITDETLIRDEAVPEGQDEDYVSGKYLYENYLATGKPYESYAGTYLYYVKGSIQEITWDQVGLYKTGDYEIVYVTQTVQSRYNFLISGGSNWIVYEELYEAGKSTQGGVTTTNYGTSVDTYMSYGPYKLASFEKDKQFVLVKNDNYFAYTDGKHEGQYQTTKIKVDILTDQATVLQMFLKGELDNVDLAVDDLEEYGASDYLLKTPETYTMRFFFNTNLDVLKTLEQERGGNTNLQIISLQDFRKAMSWCFDRETWCKEVTAGEIPQVGLLSDLYYYDIENNPASVYRNSDQAMEGIVNYYGIKYGAGERYETLKDAYRACTGYDIEEAKRLFTQAYNDAVKDGLYTDGQTITINIGAAKGASTDTLVKQEKKFNDYLAAGTKGTPLEGKVTVKYLYNINDRYTDVADGIRECGYGGLGGAAFYPYRCFNSYIDATQAVGGKISEGNFKPEDIKLDITYDFDGDGTAETINNTLFNWNASITAGGQYFDASHDVRLTILSAIEVTVLDECHCFPVTVTATVSMYSKKIQHATTNYNIMYAYGGTRLMKYNYSDFEWEAYVKSQGGTLNYK